MALIIIFSILNLLDILTTLYALSLGYEEANKVAAHFINNSLWVIIKIVLMVIIVIGALLSRKFKVFKILYIILLAIISLILLIAVTNNVIVLFKK